MPGVPNAFEACIHGIAHWRRGQGIGVVVEGQTEWDMWSVDPRRYTDYTDQDYVTKGVWKYGHVCNAFPMARMAQDAIKNLLFSRLRSRRTICL